MQELLETHLERLEKLLAEKLPWKRTSELNRHPSGAENSSNKIFKMDLKGQEV